MQRRSTGRARSRAAWIMGCVVAVAGGFLAQPTMAQSASKSSQARFFEAYFLENEKDDVEKAIALYETVVKDLNSPTELREKAESRLAACREELQTRDLAVLMPRNVLSYFEVKQPGKHLAHILKMTGLTGEEISVPSDGDGARFRISPKLVEGLGGVAGFAVGLTAVDPVHEMPIGVAVIHPGRDALLQGLIETALNAGAFSRVLVAEDRIEGFPTYVSPYATIVVTKRLIIVGSNSMLVGDALRRLKGESTDSLKQNADFRELEADRKKAMGFGYVNARSLVNMAVAAMRANGRMPEEYQLAQALGDVESARYAAFSFGASKDELLGNLWLRLDDDNHSLAFNLLRTPPISKLALSAVPDGAVGVAAFSLSESEGAVKSTSTRVVTGLDLGREIFANVRDVALFASTDVVRVGRESIPAMGLVLTVKDVGRSEALWTDLLRVPATLIQATPEPVGTERLQGKHVRVFRFPEGFEVFLAVLDDRLVLSNHRGTLERAIVAASGGPSLVTDPAYSDLVKKLEAGTSKLFVVHGQRVARLMGPIMRVSDEEMQIASSMLADSTLALFSRESESKVQAGVRVVLPKLDGVMNLLMQELAYEMRIGNPNRSYASQRHVRRGSEAAYADEAAAPRSVRVETRRVPTREVRVYESADAVEAVDIESLSSPRAIEAPAPRKPRVSESPAPLESSKPVPRRR